MTLGQEFEAFAETLAGEVRALKAMQSVLCETNMGATAIGTGLNAPAGYAQKCTDHLAKITGIPIHLADNLIEATQDTQAFVLYSSCMKSLAIKLSKVCNDLRLLSSGPRCGLREINLPAKQPGSSIMPGKVNPVIPEVVNMVCFRVIGSDLTVSMAAEGGQLQLNVFEPVIAACLFEAQTLFINAARTLRVHCVEGITANADVMPHYVEYSIGTVTALNPVIGYERATELAAEAMKTGRGILELVREKKILSEEQIAKVLDPAAMTGQRRRGVSTRSRARSRRVRHAEPWPYVARRGRAGRGNACGRVGVAFAGTWSATGVRQAGDGRGRRARPPSWTSRAPSSSRTAKASAGASSGQGHRLRRRRGAKRRAAAFGPTRTATVCSAALEGELASRPGDASPARSPAAPDATRPRRRVFLHLAVPHLYGGRLDPGPRGRPRGRCGARGVRGDRFRQRAAPARRPWRVLALALGLWFFPAPEGLCPRRGTCSRSSSPRSRRS